MKILHLSLWQDTSRLPSFAPLERDERTDVLIIGGGMAGVLCAYFLQKAGVNYLLCEGGTIGSGTTGKTTAVLSAQHDTLYCDLIKRFGQDNAKRYLEANLDALAEFQQLCSSIDCDFEEKPSYIYSSNDAKLMRDETDALRSLGFTAELAQKIALPVKSAAAVKFPGQAQFHPLKFLAEIAKDLNIREHTQVKKVDNGTAFCGEHKIQADKIIVASHFPIINTHGLFFAKLYQKRSYVIALEGAAEYDGTFVDNRKGGMYFRNYKNLLLIGGGDHRTGKCGGNFEELRAFAKKHYPGAREKYAWATQDCMSLDGVPYIGRYSDGLPNVYVATGFNEWGMTSSMAAAKILTAFVTGRYDPHALAFSPSRSMLRPQLFANMGATLLDFLSPTAKRCPHLGCALKWNPVEHSWDCPCHGSRFAKNGKLIDNPATGDLRLK
ncbi:MAG: FAD-dependent oxidoreductase [Oscillospiraceae bacterium]|nr:FAD-dependent oxidoreductase [Oscillospiraceae bacterium]